LFYLNRDGLIYNADKIKTFNNVWTQNPQKFALDHYGKYEFYHIILLVNNIWSTFLFDKQNLKNEIIIAPKENVIFQILGLSNG
jgi:tryptophan-rich sensory protein